MVIECPGCHTTYTVDMPSVAPDGVEIHCENCGRTFRIRPHGARKSEESPAAGMTVSPTTPAPNQDPGPTAFSPRASGTVEEFNPSLFLQPDRVPFSIVQAYEEIGLPRQAPFPLEAPEEMEPPYDEPEPLEAEPPDLVLDAEELDDLDQPGGLGGDDYFSTPYPLGKDLVVGKRRPKRRLRVLIWVLLTAVLIVGLALVAGKCANQVSLERAKELGRGALSLLPWKKLESGKIQISDLNGYFQDRAHKKAPVFVIEGNVTNHYKSPCHSIQVKGILFDERGNPAAEEIVYCGNVLSQAEIRSSPRKKIEQSLQNAYGSTLSNFNVEPGKSVPFMLVFFDPPQKLSEYSLEVHAYTLQDQEKG